VEPEKRRWRVSWHSSFCVLHHAFPDFLCVPAPLREIKVDLVNHLFRLFAMNAVATNEAKTHLSALLERVSRGESIVIARGRKPVAKLVPYTDATRVRPKVGEVMDEPMTVPEEALRPLDAAELQGWGLR